MSNASDHGVEDLSWFKAFLQLIFKKKFCFLFDAIKKKFFFGTYTKQFNSTIDWKVYCHKLDKLDDTIKQRGPELNNRNGVALHHDNHTIHQTSHKFGNL